MLSYFLNTIFGACFSVLLLKLYLFLLSHTNKENTGANKSPVQLEKIIDSLAMPYVEFIFSNRLESSIWTPIYQAYIEMDSHEER